MTNEEWADRICELVKGSEDTRSDILHDLNNLRGREWIDDMVRAGCSRDMLSKFMKELNILDEDLYLKIGENTYVQTLWSGNPPCSDDATGVIGIYVYNEDGEELPQGALGKEHESVEGGELDVFDELPLVDHIDDILNFTELSGSEYRIITSSEFDDIFVGKETVYRVLFGRDEDREEAEERLDELGLDYDYDSGDRMMVGQEALDELYEAGVDFDEI